MNSLMNYLANCFDNFFSDRLNFRPRFLFLRSLHVYFGLPVHLRDDVLHQAHESVRAGLKHLVKLLVRDLWLRAWGRENEICVWVHQAQMKEQVASCRFTDHFCLFSGFPTDTAEGLASRICCSWSLSFGGFAAPKWAPSPAPCRPCSRKCLLFRRTPKMYFIDSGAIRRVSVKSGMMGTFIT